MRHLLPLLALLLFALPALGQPGPPPDDDPPEGPEHERFLERLRMMRMYALTEALELDEATAAKLFPYLRTGDEAMAEVHEEMRAHRKALRALAVDGKATDKALDAEFAAMEKLEQRMTKLRAEQVEGLKGILTPDQRLKFVLTRARLEREIRSALRDRFGGGREEREQRLRDGRDRRDGPPPR